MHANNSGRVDGVEAAQAYAQALCQARDLYCCYMHTGQRQCRLQTKAGMPASEGPPGPQLACSGPSREWQQASSQGRMDARTCRADARQAGHLPASDASGVQLHMPSGKAQQTGGCPRPHAAATCATCCSNLRHMLQYLVRGFGAQHLAPHAAASRSRCRWPVQEKKGGKKGTAHAAALPSLPSLPQSSS